MLTLNKEMKGDLCVNGVPVRDNSVYTPKVRYGKTPQDKHIAAAYCAICGKLLAQSRSSISREDVLERLRAKVDNYCAKCGARLRENISD